MSDRLNEKVIEVLDREVAMREAISAVLPRLADLHVVTTSRYMAGELAGIAKTLKQAKDGKR